MHLAAISIKYFQVKGRKKKTLPQKIRTAAHPHAAQAAAIAHSHAVSVRMFDTTSESDAAKPSGGPECKCSALRVKVKKFRRYTHDTKNR